ncbi:hypothetical protein JCM24511_06866 [Saitozyma sp. JCM 24511]|nr:hypothetical protein JCM24511_06866 [Saitozyma sp. JCM 24511]
MHDLGLTIFSGLGMVLVLLPLPMHLRAGNAGTVFNIAWLFAGNLVFFVNTIIWWDSDANIAPVWCDISIKILNGLQVGLSASVLCINRRLANIATSPNVVTAHRRKRVDLAIDIILCTAVPGLAMVCAFVVQPHRANILEGYGCLYPVWSSWLAVILVFAWPPIISLVSAVYGVIAIRFFLSRRLQFQSLLKSSHSGLDTSQYLRLICLAGTELVIALPLNLWVLAANVSTLQPWTSWYEVHYNWSNIISIPASYISQAPSLAVANAVPRYLVTSSSIVFFIFFGVSEDAMGEYIRWGRRASTGLARIRSGRQQSLPAFAPRLGSTVTTAAGPISVDQQQFDNKSRDLDEEYRQRSYDDIATLEPNRPGFAIAVKVEREVV